jgi:hypothetical protein
MLVLLRVRLLVGVCERWLAVGRGIVGSGRVCVRVVIVRDFGGGDLCGREGSCLSFSVEREVCILAVSWVDRLYARWSTDRAWASIWVSRSRLRRRFSRRLCCLGGVGVGCV